MRVGAATAGQGLMSLLLWFWPPGVFWGHNHVIGAPALGCQIVPKESSGRGAVLSAAEISVSILQLKKLRLRN